MALISRIAVVMALGVVLQHSQHVSPLQSYLKAFKAKRLLQQDIVKKLAEYQHQHSKQEDLLFVVYQTMSTVLSAALSSLEKQSLTESTPFPTSPTLIEPLSLVYENCALFAELYLRYPDMTDAFYKKTTALNFKEIIMKSLRFCYNRKDVFEESNDNGKLLNLAMQEALLIPRAENFFNPHRKTLGEPTKKVTKPKEKKKKILRGPTLSKLRSEL